jgi:hypothetical protein
LFEFIRKGIEKSVCKSTTIGIGVPPLFVSASPKASRRRFAGGDY